MNKKYFLVKMFYYWLEIFIILIVLKMIYREKNLKKLIGNMYYIVWV